MRCMLTSRSHPDADQPGCSGHVHISLRNAAGENVFAVPEEDVKNGRAGASGEDTKRISEIAEHFLAGVLLGLPDIVRLALVVVLTLLKHLRRCLAWSRRSTATNDW